ncbi:MULTISPECIES: carbohydrate ABC transporter permease [Streptomyces]|uniref:Sugar ABC transporter permease n=3 Tax=Streptomyces TaxID=1883 RepID=A0A4Y3RNU2_9ACTN|nr:MULTISPECIES: carbohydrate ABC transporter permease [Streptomyces]ALO12964.1 Putative L-arabinose ABC transporter permease protein [Streptomyces venezuelae]QES18208.1 carbohydrate ABC transporter permease [Streptomyces venezuelae]QPK49655.1 carbohydrate ABC transporter permease [Streptomyces gardneri]WRK41206.1 carbohydrate ABC transporter permease [Streptomyces venezuelae]CUM36372.1 ABC-type sugar transport system, permease component [Streptomyces venezuelae]
MTAARTRHPGRSILLTSGLAIALAAVAVPFYWLAVGATHSSQDIFDSPPPLLPGGHLGKNLATLQETADFGRVVLNSLGIASVYTLLAGAVCTLAGYGFATYRFRGREALFGLLMLGLVVPAQITLVPLFKMMAELHWLNTYQAVIAPNLALPFGIFLMRQSMAALPKELLDSGRMDGCGEFRLFLRVALPPLRPALAALALFLFLYQWNDFIWPLIVLRDDSTFTIPVALASLQGLDETDYGAILAGTAIAAVPMAIVFLALQRHFVSGLLAGAVKE